MNQRLPMSPCCKSMAAATLSRMDRGSARRGFKPFLCRTRSASSSAADSPPPSEFKTSVVALGEASMTLCNLSTAPSPNVPSKVIVRPSGVTSTLASSRGSCPAAMKKLNRAARMNSGEPINTPQFTEAILTGLCGSSFARRIFATCSACLRAISVILAAKALYRWSCLSRSKVIP
jgi:hypothetical protein